MNSKTPFHHLVLLALAAVLLLGACADLFQSRIPLTDSDDPGSLGDIFQVQERTSKLASPGQVYIAPYYSAAETRFAWEPVQDAAYYRIERAVAELVPGSNPPTWEEPTEDAFEILESFIYDTSFIDNQILARPALDSPEYRSRYFYRIVACNPGRGLEESEPSAPVSAMLFRAPLNLRASGGTSTDFIQLNWDRSEGAESYDIWRSELPDGSSANLLTSVRGNQSWFLNMVTAAEQGVDFYYFIEARNSFGNNSLPTRPTYGFARMFGAPQTPANVRLEEYSGRGHSPTEIRIQWDAVDEPEAYYAVFRYSSVDSSLTRLTARTETTFWHDSQGLRPGVFYYYQIQAIIDDSESSRALRSELSTSYPEGFILSSPDTVIAENHGGAITIRWLPAIGNETERSQYMYNVYADSSVNGSFEKLVASELPPHTDAQGFITVVGLSANDSFFRVSTINGSIESTLSMVVSPTPSAAILQDVSQHAFITDSAGNPVTANANGVYPVRITWMKPEHESPSFYHVQRSTRSGSGFSRVNEIALGAEGPWTNDYFFNPQTGIYTYIDRNAAARPARRFHYRVLSLNQLQQGSFPSEERIGWGALTHEQFMLEYNRTILISHQKFTLLNKTGALDKLGQESITGAISGTVTYDARVSGVRGRVLMVYTNYAELYIDNDPANGVYFTVSGDTNTDAGMDQNGMMDGTMIATGMYPARVVYDRVVIRGGRLAGGFYGVQPEGFPFRDVDWIWGIW